MKRFELKNLKSALGKSFSAFFPSLEKKATQLTTATTPQKDLVLVSVFTNKQTQTVTTLRDITGWTVKKATDFVKQGDFPKVIQYNIKSTKTSTGGSLATAIATAKSTGVCVIEIR
jgi:hypothetical protein